jgi:hypothetical protein
MKKIIPIALIAFTFFSCKEEPKPELDMTVNYPETKKVD